MSQALEAAAAIAFAVIGLAIISVIVSKSANTPSVIQASSSGFSSIISAAVAPISSGNSMFGGITGA